MNKDKEHLELITNLNKTNNSNDYCTIEKDSDYLEG